MRGQVLNPGPQRRLRSSTMPMLATTLAYATLLLSGKGGTTARQLDIVDSRVKIGEQFVQRCGPCLRETQVIEIAFDPGATEISRLMFQQCLFTVAIPTLVATVESGGEMFEASNAQKLEDTLLAFREAKQRIRLEIQGGKGILTSAGNINNVKEEA